jgi:hypothetical protein
MPPEVVVFKATFVHVTLALLGGQLPFSATPRMALPEFEETQAKIKSALAFCGPASSRPVAATLAKSSLDNIHSSIC